MKVTSLSQWEKSYLNNLFSDEYIKNLINTLSTTTDPIHKFEIIKSLYEASMNEIKKHDAINNDNKIHLTKEIKS